MPDSKDAIVAEAAKALRDSAGFHKRASAFHRRAARRDMERFTQLKAKCQKLGITLRVEGA